MSKYICSICGFVYNEADGYPKENISPGTDWSDVPSDFVCPLCGASKNEFYKEEERDSKGEVSSTPNTSYSLPEEIDYTTVELSAIFSNLAKGCEKQYYPEMAELYQELSSYYDKKSEVIADSDFEKLKNLLQKDLNETFNLINKVAQDEHDRGSLRALKWAEQVSRMINAHLNRMESDFPDFIENTKVHVCEICGFIYIGDEKPEVCPVCKVPNSKMVEIKREV